MKFTSIERRLSKCVYIYLTKRLFSFYLYLIAVCIALCTYIMLLQLLILYYNEVFLLLHAYLNFKRINLLKWIAIDSPWIRLILFLPQENATMEISAFPSFIDLHTHV